MTLRLGCLLALVVVALAGCDTDDDGLTDGGPPQERSDSAVPGVAGDAGDTRPGDAASDDSGLDDDDSGTDGGTLQKQLCKIVCQGATCLHSICDARGHEVEDVLCTDEFEGGKCELDEEGRPVLWQFAFGGAQTTTLTYDASGLLIETRSIDDGGGAVCSVYEYDSRGRFVRIRNGSLIFDESEDGGAASDEAERIASATCKPPKK